MIKIINLGLQSPNSSMTIIQRGGKKLVLALVIEIETTVDRIGDIDPNTPVSFSVEEVPYKAALKLLGERGHDMGVLIALENGKPVSDEATSVLRDFVRRSVKALPVADVNQSA